MANLSIHYKVHNLTLHVYPTFATLHGRMDVQFSFEDTCLTKLYKVEILPIFNLVTCSRFYSYLLLRAAS
jgi:hypothetical protein